MTACATPVLVVGAGPSGITAALALARNNVPVRIIEKESEHRRGQRGAGIQPRTFEVFHFLRVPEIHERATPVLPIKQYQRGSLEPFKMFSMVDYTEPTPAIPYFNTKLMGQPTLEAIVREHLAELGCTVELGTRLVSFSHDERCVRAKVVKSRSNDGEEVEEDVEAAYMISADGAKGMTRKQLGLTFLGTTREDNFLVLGDVRLEVGLDRAHWHIFGQTSHDLITLRPTDELGKDGWRFVMSSRTIDLEGLIRDEEALVNRIKDFVGLGDDIKVKEVMWTSEFRQNMRMVNKLRVGRIFVAGGMDLACAQLSYFSVHSPAGGQGLNSSVQDAFNIAWKIALVYKGVSPASLLETYTIERLPVIAEMLGFTTEMHKGAKSDLDLRLRRKNNMYMLGVNYRSSPIVVDEFAPAAEASAAHGAYGEIQVGILRAGDRAPDAPELVPVVTPIHAPHLISSSSQSAVSLPSGMAGDTRMFDIFASSHHTVIIFAPALVVPAVRSILVALQQIVPKGLVTRVVVLPGSTSEPNSRLETSPEEDQTIDAEVLIDHAGHAYRGYIVESQEVKVVVVRPDGVVGAIVRGVKGSERYFEGVFGKKGGMVAAVEDAV
ncbi:FAD binding domain-containing protein [Pisolithus croceorrhizus]|nr:FAD binding domain-containing protein [Pisolithus croceorrhizus]